MLYDQGHSDGSGVGAFEGSGGVQATVADPAMGGRGGRPPIDQKLGLVIAARLRHGGKFSLKSLIFGHFFA